MPVRALFLPTLKELQKSFKGEQKSSCICQRMCRCLWGEFRAQLQWRMNESIDLSLWETTHEYWALTRESHRERDVKRRRPGRDRNQNEKWGTRLNDCTAIERRMSGTGRVRWVDRAFHWERRLEERRDIKETVGEQGGIQNGWNERKRKRTRPSGHMKGKRETEGVLFSDWPAPDDDWRRLVTWTLWLTGPGTCWVTSRTRTHTHTHTHKCTWKCMFVYWQNMVMNHGSGGYLWANKHYRSTATDKIRSRFLRLWL